MRKVEILNHPIAGNCLRVLRNKDTQTIDFRSALNLLGVLLAVEATKDFKTIKDTVITPLDAEAECEYVDDARVLLVPILRAGLGLVESFLKLLPSAQVGHIGVYRDHDTLEAKPYLNTTPVDNHKFDHVVVLDPMLATGNSGVKALEFVMQKGYSPENVTFVCVVATEQGINQIHSKFPEIKIITAAVDPKLNDKAYIVPGLGDAGDRLYLA